LLLVEPVTLLKWNAAGRAAEQGDRKRHGIRRDHPGSQGLWAA
jgi:hypothetical protein